MKLIAGINLQFGGDINGQNVKEEVAQMLTQNPLLTFFIDYADLVDFDWSHPIQSLRDVVSREFNYFILRRIAWSALFILIFGAPMFLLEGSSKKGVDAGQALPVVITEKTFIELN